MKPRIHILTLGVSDLDRARRFYRQGLGWSESRHSSPTIAFFHMDGGLVLALYALHALAEDAGMPLPSGADSGARVSPVGEHAFGGHTVAQNVGSEAEVRETIQRAIAAGGRMLVEPETVFWGGYRGYFADPDGHPWEVAYNPGWPFDPSGALSAE